MNQNPIRKVLSSMRTHGVQYLLMGGQACILYGGAEFSRDTDIAILAAAENLQRLAQALIELQADIAYWLPLRQELGRLRHKASSPK